MLTVTKQEPAALPVIEKSLLTVLPAPKLVIVLDEGETVHEPSPVDEAETSPVTAEVPVFFIVAVNIIGYPTGAPELGDDVMPETIRLPTPHTPQSPGQEVHVSVPSLQVPSPQYAALPQEGNDNCQLEIALLQYIAACICLAAWSGKRACAGCWHACAFAALAC